MGWLQGICFRRLRCLGAIANTQPVYSREAINDARLIVSPLKNWPD
ncbi:MAG: hypothetical protein ACFB12_00415 [Leptolyngbyaceae cyanobacterium]